MKIKFEWEMVSNRSRRAKVFGGWVFHTFDQETESDVDGNAIALSESMVFIPDVNHQWEIEK